jgi:hypothetical protein
MISVTLYPKANMVRLNKAGLTRLRKQLPDLKKLRAEVGLFADRSARDNRHKGPGVTVTNPEVGFEHEFGNPVAALPQRSFLFMPLVGHLSLAGINWIKLLQTSGVKRTLGLLGKIGVETVEEAFNTGGFGKWPALSTFTVKRKVMNKNVILVETEQLRAAVNFRVI